MAISSRDLVGPIDPHALLQGRYLYSALPILSPEQSIARTFLHWSVEYYGCIDGAYNIVVALIGGLWIAKIATSPMLNSVRVGDSAPYAAHTYGRNSHAVGIAINGMVGADPSDFGSEPAQLHEIEVLCAANAAVALKYGIDLSATILGEPTSMTHAEAAIADHYFPGDGDPSPRWDLARIRASSIPLTKDEARATGTLLRTRSRQYKIELAA